MSDGHGEGGGRHRSKHVTEMRKNKIIKTGEGEEGVLLFSFYFALLLFLPSFLSFSFLSPFKPSDRGHVPL